MMALAALSAICVTARLVFSVAFSANRWTTVCENYLVF
jgi:hypothetical protein